MPEEPWKPTKAQLAAATSGSVPDLLAANQRAWFVGINPGLYSAAVRHHFARPGNRFWPTLHAAGLTDRVLSPFEEDLLPTYGYGITNMVARATATAAELEPEELQTGAARLERLAAELQPRAVAILGVTSYRTAFERPAAKLGRQTETLSGAMIWVLPNPSGLNAHYQLDALARVFREFADAIGE